MDTYVLAHTLGIILEKVHPVVASDIGHLIMLTKFESEIS